VAMDPVSHLFAFGWQKVADSWPMGDFFLELEFFHMVYVNFFV